MKSRLNILKFCIMPRLLFLRNNSKVHAAATLSQTQFKSCPRDLNYVLSESRHIELKAMFDSGCKGHYASGTHIVEVKSWKGIRISFRSLSFSCDYDCLMCSIIYICIGKSKTSNWILIQSIWIRPILVSSRLALLTKPPQQDDSSHNRDKSP